MTKVEAIEKHSALLEEICDDKSWSEQDYVDVLMEMLADLEQRLEDVGDDGPDPQDGDILIVDGEVVE